MARKTAFIGGQDGDEGKGKIISFVVPQAVDLVIAELAKEGVFIERTRSGSHTVDVPYPDDVYVLLERYQGGSNAGHTVKVRDVTYKLHQIPSGIVFPHTFNLMGHGVFLNPRKLVDEIKKVRAQGIKITPANFGIAANAHMTLDYHTTQDQAHFNKAHHTSTGSGIMQTAVDKVGRIGIRFAEFLDPETFARVLDPDKVYGHPSYPGAHRLAFPGWMDITTEFAETYASEIEFLRPFLVQEHEVRQRYRRAFWIGEGAQGIELDVELGRYPGTTSTNPAAVPRRVDSLYGVFKLYMSSVGTGSRRFISRIADPNLESALRDAWNEFGTTTGKGREIGWFDAVEAAYAVQAAEMDYLIGTCGDRLEEVGRLGHDLQLVVGYKLDGKVYDTWDPAFFNRKSFDRIEPVFETLPSFTRFHNDGKLTSNAQRYADRIQEITDREFVMMGTGSGHEDMIVYKNPLGETP